MSNKNKSKILYNTFNEEIITSIIVTKIIITRDS